MHQWRAGAAPLEISCHPVTCRHPAPRIGFVSHFRGVTRPLHTRKISCHPCHLLRPPQNWLRFALSSSYPAATHRENSCHPVIFRASATKIGLVSHFRVVHWRHTPRNLLSSLSPVTHPAPIIGFVSHFRAVHRRHPPRNLLSSCHASAPKIGFVPPIRAVRRRHTPRNLLSSRHLSPAPTRPAPRPNPRSGRRSAPAPPTPALDSAASASAVLPPRRGARSSCGCRPDW